MFQSLTMKTLLLEDNLLDTNPQMYSKFRKIAFIIVNLFKTLYYHNLFKMVSCESDFCISFIYSKQNKKNKVQ